MLNLLFLLVLSPYTAVCVGIYATYKVYRERQQYIYENDGLLNPWNIGLILLAVWCFIVGVVNKSVLSTLASGAFVLYFSISVLIQMDLNAEECMDAIFKSLLKISVAAAIFGFFELYALKHFDMTLWRMYVGYAKEGAIDARMNSTFVNSNVSGDWFAIMILIAYYYQCLTDNKKERYKYIALCTLFLVCLILSGSRGAFLGLIGGLVTLFIAKNNRKNLLPCLAIISVIVVVGFVPKKFFAINNQDGIVSSTIPVISEVDGHEISGSFNSREDIWRGSLKMLSEKPVTGWGFTGTIENGQFFATHKVVNHSHNIWLSFAVSSGVIGLMIYLYMRMYVYWSLLSLYRAKSRMLPILAGIQMLLVAHGVIDFTIITPQIGLLFIATSAAAIALNKQEVSIRTRRPVIQSI